MKSLNIIIFAVCFFNMATNTWCRPSNSDKQCIPGSDVTTELGVCKCSDDGKDLKCPEHYHPQTEEDEEKPQETLRQTDTAVALRKKEMQEREKAIRNLEQDFKKALEEDNKRREEKRKENEILKEQEQNIFEGMNNFNWKENEMPDILKFEPEPDINIMPPKMEYEYHPIRPVEIKPIEIPELHIFI